MPPKTRVNREMLLDAAFRLVQEEGHEFLNARTVAQRLNCSTQPVMYNFSTVDALRQAVYEMADQYHTEFLMQPSDEMPMLALGKNYIRFANQEPRLFRFLFQTGQFSGQSPDALISAPEAKPILKAVAAAAGCSVEDASALFRKMFIMAHGYASLLANNAMEYDEDACMEDLKTVFRGAFHKENTL